MKIRVCRTCADALELMTGDESGRVTVWNLKTGKPIYLWEAHPKSAITQMWFDSQNHLLWTGGKDCSIRVWRLPEKWVSEEVVIFEKNEVSNVTAKIAATKLEKAAEKEEQRAKERKERREQRKKERKEKKEKRKAKKVKVEKKKKKKKKRKMKILMMITLKMMIFADGASGNFKE